MYIRVSALFYRAVTHGVLLFVLDSCAVSDVMMLVVEGTNVGVLIHIYGKRAQCQS